MPFLGADGYHSKTLSYSIWHIFRIEDIVLHTLILNDIQILESGDWQKKIGADIITTGNELVGQQIADFSKKLDVNVLYEYAKAFKESTDEYLKVLDSDSLKKKFSDSDKKSVSSCGGVSSDEKAFWLIDYWCGNKVTVHAQFSTEEEILAFVARPEFDEIDLSKYNYSLQNSFQLNLTFF